MSQLQLKENEKTFSPLGELQNWQGLWQTLFSPRHFYLKGRFILLSCISQKNHEFKIIYFKIWETSRLILRDTLELPFSFIDTHGVSLIQVLPKMWPFASRIVKTWLRSTRSCTWLSARGGEKNQSLQRYQNDIMVHSAKTLYRYYGECQTEPWGHPGISGPWSSRLLQPNCYHVDGEKGPGE